MIKNRSFPRWSGPLVGGIVGGYVAMRVVAGDASLHNKQKAVLVFCIGIGAGIAAGFLILLLEPRAPAVTEPRTAIVVPPANSGSLIGRVLAVIGVSLFCLPFITLVLSMVAVVLNRRERGWLIMSWVGVGLSALVTGLYIFMTFFVTKH